MKAVHAIQLMAGKTYMSMFRILSSIINRLVSDDTPSDRNTPIRS